MKRFFSSLFFLLSCFSLRADWPTSPHNFSEGLAGTATNFATLQDANSYVAWLQGSGSPGTYQIYTSMLTAPFTAWSPSQPVPQAIVDNTVFPAVSNDVEGNFYVGWSFNNQSFTATKLVGTNTWNTFNFSSGLSGNTTHFFFNIGASPRTIRVAIWLQGTPGNNHLYASTMMQPGQWSTPILVTPEVVPDDTNPQAFIDSSGKIYAFWTDATDLNVAFFRSGKWFAQSLSSTLGGVTTANSFKVALSSPSNNQLLIEWIQSNGGINQIFTAVSSPLSGSFFPPVAIPASSTPLPILLNSTPSLFQSGRAFTAWIQGNSGSQSVLGATMDTNRQWTTALFTTPAQGDVTFSFVATIQDFSGETNYAIATWNQGPPNQIYSVITTKGGTLTPVQLVSKSPSTVSPFAFVFPLLNSLGQSFVGWTNATFDDVFTATLSSSLWSLTSPPSLSAIPLASAQAVTSFSISSSSNGLLGWKLPLLVTWLQGGRMNASLMNTLGQWSPRQILSAGNSSSPQGALDLQGDAVVEWIEFDGVNFAIFGSRFINNQWSTPQQISDSAPFTNLISMTLLNLHAPNSLTFYTQGPSSSQVSFFVAFFGSFVPAPATFSVTQVKNRYLKQTDLVNVLNWSEAPGAVSYNIYKDTLSQPIATISAIEPRTFRDHNQQPNTFARYFISAVDSSGSESFLNNAIVR